MRSFWGGGPRYQKGWGTLSYEIRGSHCSEGVDVGLLGCKAV
jgi:hypothetical protein